MVMTIKQNYHGLLQNIMGCNVNQHVLANISHSRYNTPAVWTKWNGTRSRRVHVIAGEESLCRHAQRACAVGLADYHWALHFQCCHSNATRALTANLPNSAQLGAAPTTPPSYIQVRAIVWACGRGQTDRHTDVCDHNTFFCGLRLTQNVNEDTKAFIVITKRHLQSSDFGKLRDERDKDDVQKIICRYLNFNKKHLQKTTK